jgi:hypothetical protein
MPATFIADLKNQGMGAASIAPVTAPASSVTGTGIDLQLSDGPINALLVTGTASGGTSPTLAVKVQESDDNSNFVDLKSYDTLSGTDLNGQFQFLGKLLRNKRYVRAVATVTGSPTALPLSVVSLQARKLLAMVMVL